MLWQLWVWHPGGPPGWVTVGTSVDGVSDEIRQAVMRGLLRRFKQGQVYAFHGPTGRAERFYSPDGGTSLVKLA